MPLRGRCIPRTGPFFLRAATPMTTPDQQGTGVTDHLHLEITGGIARLLIDRPAKRNAMDQAMWEAFPRLVDAAMADPAVRLLVVASAHAGPFCAGADIGEFSVGASDPQWRADPHLRWRRVHVRSAQARSPPRPGRSAVQSP